MRYFLLFMALAVAACAGYDVTLNEKVVYSPPKLFADYELVDPSLRNCVQQNIADQGVTAAEQLTRIVCTNANIKNLEGIEIFSSLQQLNLSANSLRSIDPLSSLPALQLLLLADNKLTTVQALMGNVELLKLNLNNNAGLDCAGVIDLQRRNAALEVELPVHCRED